VTDPATLLERQLMLANYLSVGWPTLDLPGLPRASVAAIVGNATQENQCRSVTEGAKDHGSDGLFQWRLDRLTTMQAWCEAHFKAGWQAIGPQAAFFCFECKRDYPALWADLVGGTKPLETLVADICDLYERPSAAGRVLDIRIGYATAFLKEWTGVDGSTGSPPPVVVPAPASPPPAVIARDDATIPAIPDELAALAEIWTTLSTFDPATRKRMIAYLVSRIG